MSNIIPLIMAAGKGSRLKTDKAKVLHSVYGVPLINIVFDKCSFIGKPVVVVGHCKEDVTDVLPEGTAVAVQEPQLGTGHAVMMARTLLENKCDHILVLCGDAPLIRKETLLDLVDCHLNGDYSATVLTAVLEEPGAYGRVIRDDSGNVCSIVENCDASEEEKEVKEVNSSVYIFKTTHLINVLDKLETNNEQKEYYLTDSIRLLIGDGHKVGALICDDSYEIMGINTRMELAEAHEYVRIIKALELMDEGVTIIQPGSCHISPAVTIGKDTIIHPGVTLLGKTIIGSDCEIERNVTIVDSQIENSVKIRDFCYLDNATVNSGSTIGPFAHLRPESTIGKNCKVGNFVEMKKTSFGDGSKASHLSYIGDAEVGKNVNIGAGTITCNYDGKHKHKTTLEDGVFVGSDSQFVAPLTVGKNSYIGAGSTITKDVPEDSLAVARAKQFIKEGWVKRKKEKE